MIFYDNNKIRIPKNWSTEPYEHLEFVIFNRFTNVKQIINDASVIDYELFYVLEDVDLSNLHDGEYEYELNDNANHVCLSKGLIQIGKRNKNINQQYNGKETYIEYRE